MSQSYANPPAQERQEPQRQGLMASIVSGVQGVVSQIAQAAGNQAAVAAMQTEQAQPRTYTVQRGDSLSVIARNHGVTVDAIVQANGLRNPNSIAVGQVLTIPAAGQQGAGQQQAAGAQGAAQAADVAIDDAALQTAVDAVLAVVPEGDMAYARTAVPTILRQCAVRNMTDANQVAYVLATTQHESHFGTPRYSRSESLVEDRNPFRQNDDGTHSARVHTNGRNLTADSAEQLEIDYWDSAYGGRLGNEAGTTDARDYRGRGYVQLTGRTHYENFSRTLTEQGYSYTLDGVTYGGEGNAAIDLAAHPDHVNRVPELAARVMVTGMQAGSFTGRAIGDYVNGEQTDFTNARRVINGDTATNGASIAEIARTYQGALAGVWAPVFQVAEPAAQDGVVQAP